jgi:hypothetical protein
MTNESDQPNVNDSIIRGTERVAQADRALRDTAQKYIDRAGMKVDLKRVEQRIRENPVPSAAIAVVADSLSAAGWSRGLVRRYSRCSGAALLAKR